MSFIDGEERMITITVSDSLNPDAVRERIVQIEQMSRTHPVMKAVCIRNDSRSVERFIETAVTVAEFWTGKMILQSDDLQCVSRTAMCVMGRETMILCTNSDCLPMADVASSALNASLGAVGKDVESLVKSVEGLASEDIVLFPPAEDIRSCMDNIEDLKRLAHEHSISEADRPVGIVVRSGEYAVSIASVAFHTGASLVVFDDILPLGCRILGLLTDSL